MRESYADGSPRIDELYAEAASSASQRAMYGAAPTPTKYSNFDDLRIDGGGRHGIAGDERERFASAANVDSAAALRGGYFTPTTMESGPARCSTYVSPKPTSRIQSWHSAAV